MLDAFSICYSTNQIRLVSPNKVLITQRDSRKRLIQIHTGCSSLCAGCPLHRLLHDGGQPQPHARGHGAARLNRSHFAAVPSRHWQKCTPGGPPPRPRCGGAVRGADTGGPALSLSGAAPFRRRPSRGRASCRRVAVAVTLSTEHKAWHAGWRT